MLAYSLKDHDGIGANRAREPRFFEYLGQMKAHSLR